MGLLVSRWGWKPNQTPITFNRGIWTVQGIRGKSSGWHREVSCWSMFSCQAREYYRKPCSPPQIYHMYWNVLFSASLLRQRKIYLLEKKQTTNHQANGIITNLLNQIQTLQQTKVLKHPYPIVLILAKLFTTAVFTLCCCWFDQCCFRIERVVISIVYKCREMRNELQYLIPVHIT